MTEAKQNRILKKIDTLKKALRREKATFGAHHDGAGYRYSIAELYFELKDYKKTNRYLNWFDKNFPDDGKYSHYELGEAVTRFETGKSLEAKLSTINLNRHNTYLIDLIIGNQIADQNKYEWIKSENLNWAKQYLNDHRSLVTENYVKWLNEFRNDPSFEKWYGKLVSIKKLLKGLEVGKERNNLLDAEIKCLKDWKTAMK